MTEPSDDHVENSEEEVTRLRREAEQGMEEARRRLMEVYPAIYNDRKPGIERALELYRKAVRQSDENAARQNNEKAREALRRLRQDSSSVPGPAVTNASPKTEGE